MELHFSKSIYWYEALLTAKSDYANICSILISENERYWIVKFQEYEVDPTELKKEFANYLIELMNGEVFK